MCRWFAYISPSEPALLADVLLLPANAITKQCSEHYLPYLLPHGGEHDLEDAKDNLLKLRNSLLNIDGIGIAWYTAAASAYSKTQSGTRPALYKSQSPATNDFNFRSICFNTESRCLFAHIRASSGAAATPVNNHPFTFGRHAFMHNGVISDFTHIRRHLCLQLGFDAYDHIKGSTDSEHAAALYITYLCGGDSNNDITTANATAANGTPSWEQSYPLSAMKLALQRTVISILKLQHSLLGTVTPSSLNFCATDGQKIVSCRFRNHPSQQPPSLYWSEFAGRTLNRKYPGDPDGLKPEGSTPIDEGEMRKQGERMGKHTIIASEPTTYDEGEWHLIGKNCMLLVDEEGVETEVELEYDSALDGN